MLRYFIYLFSLKIFAQFSVTHYTSENGLPHDLCYQIIQDKQGYIWLGTDNGLVKFNGSTFQNYNRNQGLTNSFVIDVFENEQEKLVATWGGGCYSFDGNKFKPLNFKNSSFSKQLQIIKNNSAIYSIENRSRLNHYNIKTNKVEFYSLHNKNSKLQWYNTNKSENKFSVVFFRTHTPVNLQIEKIDQEVYCFTDKNSPQFKGILRLNKNFTMEYPYPFLNSFEIIGLNKYKSHFKAITPYSIIEFNKNKILSIEHKTFENHKILQFTENEFFKVYLLQNSKTNFNEVLVEDLKSRTKSLYNSNFLKSPISDILISTDNSIWISTYGNGVFLIQKPLIQIDKNILKGFFLSDFTENAKYNFFLTENNLFINDKNTNKTNKLPATAVSRFRKTESDTIFLIKKNASIDLIHYKELVIKSIILPNQITLNNKKITFGDNELFIYQNDKWNEIFLNLTPEEKLFLKIKKILFYHNSYWIFSNNGIIILNKNGKLIKRINQENGLLQNDIVSAFNYKNKLYLLYFTGYSIIENGIINNYPFFNNENDTFNDFVITKNGNVWFASQKGLLLLRGNSLLKFTRNEGLSSSFYSKIFLNSKKELVALGNNGVDFISANYQPKEINPKIIISNKYNAKPLQKRTIINSDQDFVIKTEVIAFEKSKSKLEYKLNHQKWMLLNTGQIDFTNFSSGTYQIQFRAKYPFSKYTYSSTFYIEKEAIWYLRWYFYIPLFILIVSIASYFVYQRLKTLKARNERLENLLNANEKLQFQLNEMRHNIAQDFHDELGNKLAGISVLSDKLLNDNSLKNNSNYPVIERIFNDSQDLFQGIRDFIWAIDSKHGSLEELIFALTDFGENLFEYSSIKFIVDNKVEDAAFLLPNFWNRQLLLLFKEAMTNAYKHSQATQLNLIFSVEYNFLIIECKDNGIGLNLEKITRKNGLLNLQKRANRLKSELFITTDLGTSIIFKGKIE